MQMEPLKGTAVDRGSARLCSKTIYYLPNAQGRPKPEVTQINVNPPQVPQWGPSIKDVGIFWATFDNLLPHVGISTLICLTPTF